MKKNNKNGFIVRKLIKEFFEAYNSAEHASCILHNAKKNEIEELEDEEYYYLSICDKIANDLSTMKFSNYMRKKYYNELDDILNYA